MVRRLAKLAALFPLLTIPPSLVGCHHQPPPAAEIPEVVISEPTQKPFTEYAFYTGRLAAVETQDVKSRVAGPIISVEFLEGAVVRAGDILYQIDPRTFQADLDVALSKVKTAEAGLLSATDDYQRKLNAGAASTAREVAAAEEKVNASKAELAAAKAEVESKRLNVEFTTIRADINGIISRTQVTRGNIVQPGQAGGTLLTTIVSMDPIYAYFDVDERTVLHVREMMREKKFVTDETRKLDPVFTELSTVGLVGGLGPAPLNAVVVPWKMRKDGLEIPSASPAPSGAALSPERSFSVVPVRLELENETGYPHKGYIDFVDNQVNPATGTLRVRGIFSNPNHILTPGNFVRVRVPLSPPSPALLVPDSAVITDQDQKVLYLLDKNDKVVYRRVALGGSLDRLRVIEPVPGVPNSGLQATDRVIVSGIQRVRPGEVARPKKADEAKQAE